MDFSPPSAAIVPPAAQRVRAPGVRRSRISALSIVFKIKGYEKTEKTPQTRKNPSLVGNNLPRQNATIRHCTH
jgi:hypothetical protein